MTFQINRSTINSLPFDYAVEVEKFRQAKMEHRFTLDAAPNAPTIVEQAIRRIQYPIADRKPDDFVSDFEIVEDVTAPPPPTLADRKSALVMQLRLAESTAHSEVISPGHERLLMLDANDVYAKDPADWSDDDKALIARLAELKARKSVVQRHFANLEIEVEDLTDATIDAWVITPFSA